MIESFSGPYAWLSNFHASPVEYEGESYRTIEHAFQAAKTFDAAERRSIRDAPTPGDAKRLGRSVCLRPDWEEVKHDIMLQLVRSKFSQAPLRDKLLATGNTELVEGNTWHDKFWGRCICQRCKRRGANHLGSILMQVRDELKTCAR